MISSFHAKYYAYELTKQSSDINSVSRISASLFNASVDLNPHQIEAALFALKSPLSKGVILADEVGLGKTIEAGLILGQYWAEKKRKLLIICPASLRRQWASEIQEKFNLPAVILDAKSTKLFKSSGIYDPFKQASVIIMSYHFAARNEDQLVQIAWDLTVIDEAHKLRNAHRESNKMGQALKRALNGRKKLLLTATPLQNSLMELYGLTSIIDDYIFGDDKAFRKQYVGADSNQKELKERLSFFIKRTLRSQVLEYVKYTKRKTLTYPFETAKEEDALYIGISTFLQREDSYVLPKKHRHLTSLILRKLLASSTVAVTATLETILKRLIVLRDTNTKNDEAFIDSLISDHDLEEEYLEESEVEISEIDDNKKIDIDKLNKEIVELEHYIDLAKKIIVDGKTLEIIKALNAGFAEMIKMGANKKAIIFTESRKTQDYLKAYFETNGYKGKVVTFSGTNTDSQSQDIYKDWRDRNLGGDSITGSPAIDKRTAILDYFKTDAELMIATEAASEGINLQFCSLLINYDLPWNPQRIEQRIGRCHRYGQKHDVVVINFLNKKNQADRRVLELLTEKFSLFNGVFGASDDVLGVIENGIDFEKKILAIYQTCRKSEEIDFAFQDLQKELEEEISKRLKDTKRILIDHFDEDIHDILKVQLDETRLRLDKMSILFWDLTKYMLANMAQFNENEYSFRLEANNISDVSVGKYHLINKKKIDSEEHCHKYRLGHPLGEFVLDSAKKIDTPVSSITFDITNHPTKISTVENLKGHSGWIILDLLSITSFQESEHLLFSGLDDNGSHIDQEVCEKLFNCSVAGDVLSMSAEIPNILEDNANRYIDSIINKISTVNNSFFEDERDKLEKWADDKILSVEQKLVDTKAKIRSSKRESRIAATVEEHQGFQKEIKNLEKKLRKQRVEIFAAEDEVNEKRDELIDKLEKEMKHKTSCERLFTIKWNVV